MAKIDIEYHKLLDKILQEGYTYEDPNRKGVNRIEIPSYTFRHEFKDGFPAITTKKLHYKNVVTELIWFLRGDTNIKYLVDNGCNIWNKDAYNYFLKSKPKLTKCTSLNDCKEILFEKDNKSHYDLWLGNIIQGKKENLWFGDLGKVYGHYWRNYDGFDQIKDVIDKMINAPMSSEIIVTARNPNDKGSQALPCCHYGFQIVMRPLSLIERYNIHTKDSYYIHMMMRDYSEEKCHSELDSKNIPKYGFELHWDQRSCDLFLGIPYNIASYATLALILEKITGHKALAIQPYLKKVHLYDNSLDSVKEQLNRDVNKYGKCELNIIPDIENSKETHNDLFELLENDDFELQSYESYSAINIEMLERDE